MQQMMKTLRSKEGCSAGATSLWYQRNRREMRIPSVAGRFLKRLSQILFSRKSRRKHQERSNEDDSGGKRNQAAEVAVQTDEEGAADGRASQESNNCQR
jgi:hypothetical protein